MIFTNCSLLSGQEPSLRFATVVSQEVRDQIGGIPLLKTSGAEDMTLGRCFRKDTTEILARLREEQAQGHISADIWFAFSGTVESKECDLFALRREPAGYSPVREDIQTVDIHEDPATGTFNLLISFNEEGAEKWARMTGDHLGDHIAMVIGGMVISAPEVKAAIKGGKCMVSGHFDHAEAKGLKAALGF